VWVFAQRAIKELLDLLPAEETVSQPEPLAVPDAVETAVPERQPEPITTPPIMPEFEPEIEPELDSGQWLDIEPEDLANLLASETELLGDTGDLNAFWEEALAESDKIGGSGGLSLEEAQRRGLLPTDLDFDDQSD
jgi:hypothetical protein